MCSGKRRFPSSAAAAVDAAEITVATGVLRLPYSCRFCPHYHYGRPRLRQARNAAQRAERARRKTLWKTDA